MKVRALTDEDLPELLSWFGKRKWPRPPAIGILPKTGFVAERDGKLVAATWYYITNASVAIMEWNVTDPDLSPQETMRGLGEVVKHVKNFIKTVGVHTLFHWTGNDKLAKYYHKRHKFKKGPKETCLVWQQEV